MAGYQPKVYREQGGNKLVVAQGGTLQIDGAVTGQIFGTIYHVSSTTGSNGNTGLSWADAVATIDYAVGLCTANKGDIILVAPGHAETLVAAAGIVCDIAGVSIIGLGSGTKRPRITMGTIASVDIDIDAANVTIQDVDFIAAIDDVVAAVDVNATDFTLRGCRFLEPTTNSNFLICVLGATSTTSSNLIVENCEFRGLDAANTHGVSLTSGTPDSVIIRNNLFLGVFETGAIFGSGAATQLAVYDNFINNTSGDADECISLAGTGVVCRNIVGNSLAGNATTNITCGTTMTMAENYSTDKGDVQGVLDPVAT